MVAAPLSLEVGHVVAGKYRVERVLGAGGMGIVVAAQHLGLGERVAIKVLRPEALGRPEIVTRFLREGRAAVRIRSEHVARVLDVGTLEDGAPYLVMEYLDGRDLAQVLDEQGPLPPSEAIEYVLQACEALAEAHALGIVHRDLKPANLFLTARADGSPVIKIIDFGISKLPPSALAGSAGSMTQTHAMMGSPLYMSPEQMMSARDVDARADIWSLGVILYDLLTGTTPFVGDTIVQIFQRVQQGQAPPLRLARPDAPAALEAIVQRCLRREPSERFANVAELAAALADLAPPHARVSAERAARVIRAAGGVVTTAPCAAVASAATGVSTEATRTKRARGPALVAALTAIALAAVATGRWLARSGAAPASSAAASGAEAAGTAAPSAPVSAEIAPVASADAAPGVDIVPVAATSASSDPPPAASSAASAAPPRIAAPPRSPRPPKDPFADPR